MLRASFVAPRSPLMAVAVACVATLGLCLPLPAASQTAGFLSDFQGVWNGTGTLTHRNGAAERIRCQVTYAPVDARTLQQRLRCTSDSSSFDIVANLVEDAGRLSGDWTELSRNARGSLSGRISRGSIGANVQGPGFTASVSMATKGRRQSVNIQSQGGDIASISMTVNR
ncbi:MAG: hypothetical protein JWL62_1567 [Hyphomicrobiales bacterium]|nr:hypothetical protein [Hyphomicrobiales bacterium]